MATETLEQQSVDTLDILKKIEIAAPIEIVFESLLAELGPEGQMMDGKPCPLKIEPWPGGRWYRDLGNNSGHFWGHVQVIKPPTLLEITGPMPMSYPAINHLQYRLEPSGDGTRLTLHHTAMGVLLPDHREGMPKGWEFKLGRVREIAEREASAAGKKRK
jgi:uncharacterized protein YndB with AHSA1/START domain